GVLGSVRGAGFPVAYMLVKNQVGVKDAQFQAVRKFLRELKERGLRPKFFHSDKDWSQIKAIRSLWPESQILSTNKLLNQDGPTSWLISIYHHAILRLNF